MPAMRQFMPAGAHRSARRQHVVTLLGLAAAFALLADLTLPAAFTGVRPTVTPSTPLSASVGYQSSAPGAAEAATPAGSSLYACCGAAAAAGLVALAALGRGRSEALDRRQLLAAFGAAAAAPAVPAFAAEIPFLGRPRGPFEIDAKDVVIIGDDKSEKAVTAKNVVLKFQKEAQDALDTLAKDPQADLAPTLITKFGIADLRDATNTINNLVDESSAAGTQRHQRLMIQAKYALEDDLPMPVSKKGVVQGRGEKRLQRITRALDMFVNESKELMAIFQ